MDAIVVLQSALSLDLVLMKLVAVGEELRSKAGDLDPIINSSS